MSKNAASSTEHHGLSLSLAFLRQQTSHNEQVNIINAMIYSVQQRVELLRHGLGERVASVKKQASLMLRTWLDDTCRSAVVKLLVYLDVQSHEGLCICLLLMIFCGLNGHMVCQPILTVPVAVHLHRSTAAAGVLHDQGKHIAMQLL